MLRRLTAAGVSLSGLSAVGTGALGPVENGVGRDGRRVVLQLQVVSTGQREVARAEEVEVGCASDWLVRAVVVNDDREHVETLHGLCLSLVLVLGDGRLEQTHQAACRLLGHGQLGQRNDYIRAGEPLGKDFLLAHLN